VSEHIDWKKLQRRSEMVYFAARFDCTCQWCPLDNFMGDTMAVTATGEYICEDCAHEEEELGGA
jgi:superfamily II helicase